MTAPLVSTPPTALPRLTRAWTHLSRQAGGVGIGMKGPGETQLETDRRLVRKRIADLSRKLEKMDEIRAAQHNRRIPTFHAALVGYTNAGKSTLMNALTRAGVEAVDRLFATLHPTTLLRRERGSGHDQHRQQRHTGLHKGLAPDCSSRSGGRSGNRNSTDSGVYVREPARVE